MTQESVTTIDLPDVLRASESGQPLVQRNLALLGHVNIKLDVVLGSSKVSVDKLFSLSAGEVLSLDANLDDPVQIRLDAKVVAMGQLVAVGDHFGVKITEIL